MGFDDDIAIFAAAPVFGFFERDALRLLSFAGDRRTLAPGDRLFARGERSDGGYVVLAGAIALRPRRGEGAPVVAGRSALIGRLALFRDGERPSDAHATEATEVMRIAPSLMNRMLREFPDAAAAIHDWLAEDLRDLARDLGPVRERLLGTP